jgi:RHS repeat-associated protein
VGVSYYVSGSDALSGTNALGRNAYAYDPFNQWISRKVDLDGDFGSTPIEQTFFLWENGQIVLEFDKEGSGSVAAGDLSHRYLWGPAVDMLLADEQVFDGLENEGEVYWALTDHLGSVRDVVDNNGTLRIHRGYDAYGNVFGETHYNASGNVVTPGQSGYVTEQFSFTGKFFEVYIDQYYNWHRWYDPATGSWTSQDFIWDGANKYAYVGNEVTGYVDSNELERSGPWWNNDWTDEWNPYAWFVARGDDVGNTVSSWWYFSFENDQSRRLQAISMGRNGDPAANCPDDHRRHQRLGPISSSAASGLAEAYGEFASGVPALATGITVGVVIRNAHLAGRRHPVTGILFDADGFPDFSTVAARRVRVTFSGNYADDFAAANARAGFDRTPDGFTWHHHQDGTTMELVPTNIHQKTGHTGGMSLRQCEE